MTWVFRLLLLAISSFLFYGLFFVRQTHWKKKHTRLFILLSSLLLFLFLSFIPFTKLISDEKNKVKEQEVAEKKKEQTEKKAQADKLIKAWESRIKESPGTVDIAFYHPQFGETVQYTNGSKEEVFHTASIVKVAVLLGMLEKYGVEGTLTTTDRTYLTNMIEHSSNEAATYLVKNRLGGQSGLDILFRQLKMNDTHASVAWGMTTTTAVDQIKLLKALFYEENLLQKEDQVFVKELMTHVEPDQAWGISKGASQFAVKNGWLSIYSDGWIVNSIGQVYDESKPTTDYLLVILTKGEESQQSAIDLIEDLAELTRENLPKSVDKKKADSPKKVK